MPGPVQDILRIYVERMVITIEVLEGGAGIWNNKDEATWDDMITGLEGEVDGGGDQRDVLDDEGSASELGDGRGEGGGGSGAYEDRET